MWVAHFCVGNRLDEHGWSFTCEWLDIICRRRRQISWNFAADFEELRRIQPTHPEHAEPKQTHRTHSRQPQPQPHKLRNNSSWTTLLGSWCTRWWQWWQARTINTGSQQWDTRNNTIAKFQMFMQLYLYFKLHMGECTYSGYIALAGQIARGIHAHCWKCCWLRVCEIYSHSEFEKDDRIINSHTTEHIRKWLSHAQTHTKHTYIGEKWVVLTSIGWGLLTCTCIKAHVVYVCL